MADLAASSDLQARGITVSGDRATALLASASEAVRSAAGDYIGPQTTSTITLMGQASHWLPLPLYAVTAAKTVSINGVPVTDALLLDGRLYRPGGWQGSGAGPAVVSVEVTHGLATVPADIIDLVCSLVAAGATAAEEDGYDPKRGVANERIDDYGRGFATGESEIVNPMDLPERTREWLRSRFGSAVAVTGSYS
ncbi:hypothetical protein [Oerskovia turbata]